MCPNLRVLMRRGNSLKKSIQCREKDCKWNAYLTLVGRIHRYRRNEAALTTSHSHWLLMFHKGIQEHLEIRDVKLL